MMAIIRSYNQPMPVPTVAPAPEPVATVPIGVVPEPVVSETEERLELKPPESEVAEPPPGTDAWSSGFLIHWTTGSVSITESPERPAGVEQLKKTTVITLQGKGGRRIEFIVIPGGIEPESEITKEEQAVEEETTAPPEEQAPS